MAEPYAVLHGGFHKTASTFLQKTLQRNKGRLARAGVRYIPHRDLRKCYTVPSQQNAYNHIGIRRKTIITDEELHSIGQAFFAPIKDEMSERVILSDENLAGHCGNCVKTGQLYRYRDAFIGSFARELPFTVREIFLGVRNYADFFSAAYVEYYRSLQSDSTEITPSRQMCTRVFNHMPGWNGVINVITRHFPDAHIYVWRFEDFVAEPKMARALLRHLVGGQVDPARFKEPKGNSQRPSASGRAMAELELLARTAGIPEMVERRQELQLLYPRGEDHGSFDPWHPWEREHLIRLYEADMARLRTNASVTILGPDATL